MPHIHSKPGQHDVTASAFIVRVKKNQKPKILLHRQKRLDKLAQPGGHVELTENPWQTVIHEIREETGYEISQLKVLQSASNLEQSRNPEQDSNSGVIYLPIPIAVSSSYLHSSGEHTHDDLAFAFLTIEMPKNEVDKSETSDFCWVGLEELSTLPDDKVMKDAREISKYVLENFENWRAEGVDKFGGGEWRS
jgi:8-oxo-dGTP pyrophosphatase MutT (NUDIX family)